MKQISKVFAQRDSAARIPVGCAHAKTPLPSRSLARQRNAQTREHFFCTFRTSPYLAWYGMCTKKMAHPQRIGIKKNLAGHCYVNFREFRTAWRQQARQKGVQEGWKALGVKLPEGPRHSGTALLRRGRGTDRRGPAAPGGDGEAREPRLTCEPVCRWHWTWDGNSPSTGRKRKGGGRDVRCIVSSHAPYVLVVFRSPRRS